MIDAEQLERPLPDETLHWVYQFAYPAQCSRGEWHPIILFWSRP